MKYVKILSLAAIASLAFACGKTDYPAFEYGPKDTESKTEVYFTESCNTEEIDAAVSTVEITVGRKTTTGALTVPIVVLQDAGGTIKVDENAVFADGAATTTISADISEAAIAEDCVLEIAIPSDYYYLYKDYGVNGASISYRLNFQRIAWSKVATGSLKLWLFGAVVPNVDLMKCESVPGRYRIIEPIEEGYNLEFFLEGDPKKDDDGNTYTPFKLPKQETGNVEPTYGMISVEASDPSKNCLYEDGYFYMLSKYTVAAGSFGTGYDEFTPAS